jgi:O-antigen/teichoic acid export membrane protein
MNDDRDSHSTQHAFWRPDSLAASVVVLLVVTIVQRTVGFGRGILFCRWLPAEELGEWEMAYSFLLLAAPVIVLGLPGSFGRYLERYRRRDQLRAFLRRATAWTGVLTALAGALIVAMAGQFSELIFGRGDRSNLVILLAISLVCVIAHHFLEALYAALRKFRIVSIMHFCQSLLFAVISLGLMLWWRSTAESIIVGYGLACLISCIGALMLTSRDLAAVAAHGETPSHRTFWPPLVRFAIWVWVTNLLCHLFAVIDRYMLVHCSGLDDVAALAQVGHYHASRIVPLLFLSVADLMAGVVLPYLSHDWETGHRERVAQRLGAVLKFASVAMLTGGVAVLAVAPILFGVAFQGRYDDGLAVLPFTLAYCTWYGLLLIGQTYLWCAERMKTGTIPLAAGLAANIVLNLILIPTWGLLGAVVATTIATGLALAVLYFINRRIGMPIEPGVIWLSLAPAALCGGYWPTAAVVIVIIVLLPKSRTLVTPVEREMIRNVFDESVARFRAAIRREASTELSRGRQPTEVRT